MSEKGRIIGIVEISNEDVGRDPHIALVRVGVGGFATELRRAQEHGENPAEALLFLAKLGASHCNPHHTQLSGEDRALWEKYFAVKAKTLTRKPKLSIVQKKK